MGKGRKRKREKETENVRRTKTRTKPITDPTCPQYTPSLKGNALLLSDTLVPAPAQEENQEQDEVEEKKPI